MNEPKPVVLIPALQPKEGLPKYIKELKDAGLEHILLVDDGSGEAYRRIFEECEKDYGATVLRHETNLGKGAALKTGFAYFLEHSENESGVVTADSDGQHKTEDILRITEELKKHPDSLILGVRDFTGKGVPPKSRGGNLLTIKLFHLLYGKRISDTQTGLRGIGGVILPEIRKLKGKRFEYEMGMLIHCVRRGVPIIEVPIETIYHEENKGTHFRPIVDSIKIYGYLLGSFLKYTLSSLSAALIDLLIFTLCNMAIFSFMSLRTNIFLSTLTARVVSSIYNFLMNRNLVFSAGEGRASVQAVKYYLLVILQMLCSAGLVYIFVELLSLNASVVKVVVDTVLFFVSFQIQNRLIFGRRNEKKEGD